jgi:prevent-host-death family protein
MKLLSDRKLLAGEHEVITIVELCRAPGEALLQVRQGKRFTITKHGKPMAMLTPVGEDIGVESENRTGAAA